MKKFCNILTLLAVSAMMLPACSEHDEADSQLTLSLDVILPVNSAVETTRTIGDPGLAEFFERPNHLYLYLAIGEPKTPADNPVYLYHYETGQDRWTRSADSLIFQSSMSMDVSWDKTIPLKEDMKCRAYMVASFDPIMTDKIIACNSVHKVANMNEKELLDLKFYASSSSNNYRTPSLRDVYSTPYNLSEGWGLMANADADRTGYYGTVSDIRVIGDAGIIKVSDTLYHTAAKIDFQWNAKDPVQANKMVNAIVNNAPSLGYLFRPACTANDGTYRKVLLDGGDIPSGVNDLNNDHQARYANAMSVNVGNQWSGRAYTYVLQPGNLNYTLTTTEGGTHDHTTTRPNSNGMTNEIFAAWYKLDFNLLDAPSN